MAEWTGRDAATWTRSGWGSLAAAAAACCELGRTRHRSRPRFRTLGRRLVRVWNTADFTLFTPTWFRKNPYQDPEEFLSRSPVRYVEKIKTPMMFIEGDEDYRTPPGQGGEAMFRALKAEKKTAVMVSFPGENHELSRSGKPSHRVERLQHIVNWFDMYLQGREIHLYDLQ